MKESNYNKIHIDIMEDKNMMLILATVLMIIDVLMEMETLDMSRENKRMA